MSTLPVQSPTRVIREDRTPTRQLAFPRILDQRQQQFKRVLDIVFASALAFAAFPVILLIALAVRLTSRGPVFFAHERVGRGGKVFRVWKFRTMFADADTVLERFLDENPDCHREWQEAHKLKDDPRVTAIGRILRRTSLDELPQIWNVLKGDMSMVGPRPITSAEADKYGGAYILYSQVKPGITGLWQVSGRNDTSYRHRVELDTQYIRTWTPRADFAIVARTFRAVLTGKGAY